MRHYHTKLFYRQSGADTTLGTKNSEGLYLSYRPLLFFGLAEVDTPLSR